MKAQRLRSKLLPLLLLLTLSAAAHSATRAMPNPVPLVNNPLVPDAVAPGSQGFTLTVNGTGFVAGSVVNWNGSPLATTFVNASQVTAVVPAEDVAVAGTASVTVASPSPGGGSSNVAAFTIRSPFTAASFGRSDMPTAKSPGLPISADFNRDGKADLALIASSDGAIVVFIGKGDGTFEPPVEYSVLTSPEQVVSSDFNGDGFLDLAVVDLGGTVSILLGQGDGTFQGHRDVFVSDDYCIGIAVADFNHDGKLDVAVSDWYPGARVFVLLGNGDGTFLSPVPFAAGTDSGQGIVAGDFNRDGKIDLAVVLHWENQVAILLGNGDGTFQAGVEYPAGVLPPYLAAADLNGDGTLDLAVSSYLGVSVLLGNGDGTFQPSVDYKGEEIPNYIVAADLSGDDKLDLIVSNAGTLGNLKYSTITTFSNKGDGRFIHRSDFTVGTYPYGIAVGDFNGDGKLDVVATNVAGNTISILPQVTSVLSRTYFNFGKVKVGDKSTRKVTLSNIGDTSFTINRIVPIGKGSAGFAVRNNCGSELGPGANCKITIVFQPQSPVPYRHVRVKVSSSVAKQKIYLLGSGVK